MAAQRLSVLAITPSSSATNQSCKRTFEQVLSFNPPSSFVGTKLSIQPSSFSLIASRRRSSSVSSISCTLPTTERVGIDSDKKLKWSARAIKAFLLGQLEGRKLKYPQTGTEAILMGILLEGTSLAAKYLREMGVTFFEARERVVELLGKGEMFLPVPAVPPLTGPAQRAIDWAAEEKLKSGDSGEITTTYLLLGIWAQKGFAAHRVLASFGFDDDKAEELAKTMDTDVILSIKPSIEQLQES